MNNKKTVNILGAEYTITKQKEQDNPKLADANGLCEFYTKEIILNDFDKELMHYANLDKFKDKVLRHEIVHAFLFEGGLDSNSSFARDEELVDWIALQLPKMFKVCEQLEILE